MAATFAHRFGLYFFASLFLLFSALVRYWLYHLPGGRYASLLPAHLVPQERNAERLAEWAAAATLYERLRTGSWRRRLERMLDEEKHREVNDRLAQMREGLLAADAAAMRAARSAALSIVAPARPTQRAREALDFLATLAAAAGLVFLVRSRVAQPYVVEGTSMLPTLEDQDRILGNKLAYVSSARRPPRRGDVLVFRSSAVGLAAAGLPDFLVKRVIGLPGDRIEMHGNVPVINGWPVPVCAVPGFYAYWFPDGSGKMLSSQLQVEFLENSAYLTLDSAGSPFRTAYVVQPGEVFVLGDNRGNSLDSRAFRGSGGGVPLDAIESRAERFLAGTHRSGEVDMGRLLRPLDALQTRVRLEGLDSGSLEAGVLRCLRDPPKETRPPPPEQVSASRDPGG
jgi:signal peptidase I